MTTLNLVKKIFLQPTAPFFEGWVLGQIEEILNAYKIPYFFDASKNLIAGVSSPKALKQARLGFIAHTDHPGFHIQKKISATCYKALWYGGAPLNQMKGASIVIYHPLFPGRSYLGKIHRFPKQKYQREGLKFEIKTKSPLPFYQGTFGAFNFPSFQLKGTKIYSRAADDLTGVVIILGTLINLKSKLKNQIVGLFTRAEEVGFVGFWSLLKSGLLPRQIQLVSLEASRELPGAQIGQGPVLRIGDASTIFNSELSIALWKTAKETKVSFQRRLMDGGSCEATAAHLFGYQTTGIAVPLGNYHNQGPAGPAAEIVDLRDIEGARRICTAFAQKFLNPTKKVHLRTIYEKNFRTLKPLLLQKMGL